MLLLLLHLLETEDIADKDWAAPGVKTLYNSLMDIPATYEVTGGGSAMEARAKAASEQNADARAAPAWRLGAHATRRITHLRVSILDR